MKKRVFIALVAFLFLIIHQPAHAQDELTIRRIAGQNRYETAIAVNQDGFSRTAYAVLASGANFPDALAGGPLAAALDAPLYVTPGDHLSNDLKNELKRLQIKTVYLLGGESSIHKTVEESLSDYDVIRLGGANRYDTADLIYQELTKFRQNGPQYYANGQNFPDALAASSFIHAKQGFLHLVPSHVEVTRDGAIAIGGARSVSGELSRIAGENRYETALAIAKTYPQKSGTAIVVQGTNFPDALSASGYAASIHAPIFLTHPERMQDNVVEYIQKNFNDVIIIGGESSVSKAVEAQLLHKEPTMEYVGLWETYSAARKTEDAYVRQRFGENPVLSYGHPDADVTLDLSQKTDLAKTLWVQAVPEGYLIAKRAWVYEAYPAFADRAHVDLKTMDHIHLTMTDDGFSIESNVETHDASSLEEQSWENMLVQTPRKASGVRDAKDEWNAIVELLQTDSEQFERRFGGRFFDEENVTYAYGNQDFDGDGTQEHIVRAMAGDVGYWMVFIEGPEGLFLTQVKETQDGEQDDQLYYVNNQFYWTSLEQHDGKMTASFVMDTFPSFSYADQPVRIAWPVHSVKGLTEENLVPFADDWEIGMHEQTLFVYHESLHDSFVQTAQQVAKNAIMVKDPGTREKDGVLRFSSGRMIFRVQNIMDALQPVDGSMPWLNSHTTISANALLEEQETWTQEELIQRLSQ